MATTYSTPGVYVVEKSIFPPSVAQVPTAVPAFIGYTEKAMNKVTADLYLRPTRIRSLLEYERYFGRGPQKVVNSVDLAADNTVAAVDIPQQYFTYDSIRMFYANGGGECYIISIGDYLVSGNMLVSDFENGLTALEKKDEPTIILFPDAVQLLESQLYELQKKALMQCAKLQDRVGVFDIFYRGEDAMAFATAIETFRNTIGVNNLKYGAAYTPWLKSSLPREFTYADIHNNITKLGVPIQLGSLVSGSNTQLTSLISDYDTVLADRLRINDELETFLGIPITGNANLLDDNLATILTDYEALLNDFKVALANPAATPATLLPVYQPLFDYTYGLIEMLDILAQTTVVVTADLNGDINSILSALAPSNELLRLVTLDLTIDSLVGYIGNAAADFTRRDLVLPDVTDPTVWVNEDMRLALNAPAADNLIFLNNTTTPGFPDAAMQVQNMSVTESIITKAFVTFYQHLLGIDDSVAEALKAKEDALYNTFLVYKNIIDYVNRELTLLPPSGAVAGVYASVDASRGVWKAPANVSLNNVNGVTIELTDEDQSPLNVDVNSGKSVNVIRPFTGKGILVWGARTLAGNDNEWRYVSVRRFFNMVEESVKKSTFWAVFESNDANTWNKVKGMIDNFLIIQWRNGALQGAKPDEAFYVKIGLGQTMTSLDILEGRMNVEIGMAVVRPAEFIILTFSHKLVTS